MTAINSQCKYIELTPFNHLFLTSRCQDKCAVNNLLYFITMANKINIKMQIVRSVVST